MTSISTADTPAHAVFGMRDFRLFIGGRFLSTASMQMQSVAIGWQVYDLTRDPVALGYVGLCMFLSVAAFTLPAGDAADRIDRRLVLTLSYILQGVCGLLLVALSWSGLSSMWPVYGTIALFGVGRAFANPASQSFVPFLVPREQVSRAVAWSSSVNQVAFIVGPALGGVIYVDGPVAVYSICLVAFIGAAIATSLIRTHVKIPPSEPDVTTLRRLVAGVHFVRARPIVLGVISLDLFAVLLGGALSLLPIYARDILHVGPEGLGMLRSAVAAGAMATAVVVANLSLNRRAGLVMFGAVGLYALCTVAFGVSTNFTVSLAALAVLGAADQVSVITRNTVIQLATPAEMRGRVSALHMLFVGTSNELGQFRAGTFAGWLGTIPAVVVGGVGTLGVVGLWSWLFPDLRRVDRLADLQPD